MRTATVILVVLVLASGSSADEFFDTFDEPDGSLPSEWTWTGDPRGGGEFQVQSGTFAHVDGGHVHYFRHADVTGVGRYEFDVMDSYWSFAWRITTSDPDQGRCLELYHNDYWGGQWKYSLTEFSWYTLGGYPQGQYMWPNGSNLDIVHHTSGPVSGWHHITVVDELDQVQVWVDGSLIFDEQVEPIPEGYIGLGSATGSGTMTPQFDNVRFSFNVPVEDATWGAVKALFK